MSHRLHGIKTSLTVYQVVSLKDTFNDIQQEVINIHGTLAAAPAHLRVTYRKAASDYCAAVIKEVQRLRTGRVPLVEQDQNQSGDTDDPKTRDWLLVKSIDEPVHLEAVSQNRASVSF